MQRNLPNPYNVSLNKGLYFFNTDQGLTYTCGFRPVNSFLSPVLGIYDLEIHDFEFYPHDPKPEVKKSQDKRVAPTIVNLLDGFFSNENRVLVYVCDNSDDRAKERQTLFKRWHQNLSDTTNLDNLQIEVGGVGTAYGSVLTRKDLPFKDILQNELVDKARGIVLEKYDL